jgi:L-lactate dehydrogenase (cytochrome)
MVIKGILDADDARDAKAFGADGIVVSNHGGRQLDGALSTAKALPSIAAAVKGDLTIFADSGVRTGLDVVRLLALGADGVLIGRAFIYALATGGAAGVRNLLAILEKDIRTSMVLTGVQSVRDIGPDCLA